MRLFFRSLSLVLLSIAVISAVVDVARSLAASSLTMTSLFKGWSTIAPSSLQATQGFLQDYLPDFLVDPVLSTILNFPAAAVFATLSVLFYMIGAKRERPFGQIVTH